MNDNNRMLSLLAAYGLILVFLIFGAIKANAQIEKAILGEPRPFEMLVIGDQFGDYRKKEAIFKLEKRDLSSERYFGK